MSSAGVGCLYGVGVGPGDPELLTLKAVRVLKAVPIVFTPQALGSKDSLALTVARNYVDESRQRLIYASFVMGGTSDDVWSEAAERIAVYLLDGEDVAFLTQGDPLLYGSFHVCDGEGAGGASHDSDRGGPGRNLHYGVCIEG